MDYICSKCGKKVSVSTRQARCSCGGLWKLDFTPPPFRPDGIDKSQWSQFRYRKYMALEDESWRELTLGEGMTPVVRMDGNVLLKMDYMMPTLSYKDRGAAVLMAHCKAAGVDYVVQDSSGNAGNSIAAYASRAGIPCEIFVPQGTSPKKIAMIRAHGAVCTVVPGSRDHCAAVCREKADREGLYYANHVYNPFFYEGTKTYIYEVMEQLGRIPEHLVIPVGNGTLFLGAVKALEHARVSPEPTLAEGIAIGVPMRGEEILEYAYKYHVQFIHAPEEKILEAREILAGKGIYCEHTTAANYAAYLEFCRQNGETRDCLITMCGAGLKSDH